MGHVITRTIAETLDTEFVAMIFRFTNLL